MKSEIKYSIVIVLCFIFTAFLANASINHLHNTILQNYTGGETVKGRININIANQPGDTRISSNFNGNITLLELLRKQSLIEGSDYTCNTNGCYNDYSSDGQISQLNVDGTKFAGFGIDGTGISITGASLRVNTNAPASCNPSVFIDLLADGDQLLTSTSSSGESCGIKHTGCYNQSNTQEAVLVTGKEYCEKISIPAGPSFILGAKIRQGTGESNLTMKLYNYDTTAFLGSC